MGLSLGGVGDFVTKAASATLPGLTNLSLAGQGPLGGLSGGSVSPVAPQTTNFTSPGLSGTFSNGTFNVTRSPGLTSLLNSIQSRSGELAGSLGGLLSRIAPGVSELRASRLQGLENRRRRAIGNLRDNLARRRIAGSSFASDAITRSELAFEQEADRIRAESTMTEIEATQQLLQQQAAADIQGFNAALSQMNFESTLGAQLATSTSDAINAAMQFNAGLQQQENAADQAALGDIAQLGTTLALAAGA